MYLATIVTVVRNGQAEIEITLASVVKRLSENFEYIVIDGASTDATLKIIEKYKSRIDIVVSEPDNGIYDAMNKAIAMASGAFVYFLNAGDALLSIAYYDLKNSKADMICFPVLIDGKKVMFPRLNWKFRITNTLPHQGIFYKKQPSLKFQDKYKVFGDYALSADYVCGGKKISIKNVPVVASHKRNGISNNKKSNREFFEMIRDKFGYFFAIASFIYFKVRGIYCRLYRVCFSY